MTFPTKERHLNAESNIAQKRMYLFINLHLKRYFHSLRAILRVGKNIENGAKDMKNPVIQPPLPPRQLYHTIKWHNTSWVQYALPWDTVGNKPLTLNQSSLVISKLMSSVNINLPSSQCGVSSKFVQKSRFWIIVFDPPGMHLLLCILFGGIRVRMFTLLALNAAFGLMLRSSVEQNKMRIFILTPEIYKALFFTQSVLSVRKNSTLVSRDFPPLCWQC